MAYAFGSVNIRNDLKNIPDRGTYITYIKIK